MFLMQKFEHPPRLLGSPSGGVWANSDTWKSPAGSSWPKRTPDFLLSKVRLKPASFHWLWRICSVSSRRLLPVVDRITRSARWPPLAQMPSAPLAQPSPFMRASTLDRSRVYLLNEVWYHFLAAGVPKLWM